MIDLNQYEAVIFDMDGVLIDSEPLWKIAMEEVFQSVGCMITKLDFQHTVGLRIDEVVNYWFRERGWTGLTALEVEQKIIERMVELIGKNGTPLIGVIETLDFLRANKIKIALATSSSSDLIDAVLRTLHVEDKFDALHSAEKEDFGKPHPAVYISAAKQLGVDASKCLVVEDSLNGIISGRAARMKVICIPEKTHQPEPKLSVADYTFSNMELMLAAFKKGAPKDNKVHGNP